ncbi:MAG: hypothetical protein CM15mP36_05840 [Flavobacteriales bacterium]|nr:MAG: hypothetical protein CM15mP36_05840 [Flavobacteriales bacterium]
MVEQEVITIINSSTLTVSGDVTNDGEIILGTNVGGVGTMDISGDVANETFITINEGSTMILSSTSTMNADGQLTINSSSSTFGSLVCQEHMLKLVVVRYLNTVDMSTRGWRLGFNKFTRFWITDIFIYKF